VLGLAATNVLAAVLFGGLYAAAGARYLSQPAFLAGLVILFALLTRLWVLVEGGRERRRDAFSRIGRVALALVVTLLAVPIAVLLPLFSLERLLPPGEAAAVLPIAAAMAVVLIALVLAVAVNVAGVLVIAGSTVVARLRRPRDGRPDG
jgi:hypothetical protein